MPNNTKMAQAFSAISIKYAIIIELGSAGQEGISVKIPEGRYPFIFFSLSLCLHFLLFTYFYFRLTILITINFQNFYKYFYTYFTSICKSELCIRGNKENITKCKKK